MRIDLALSRDQVQRLGMGEVVVAGGTYSISAGFMVAQGEMLDALGRGEAVKAKVLGVDNELHQATLQCDELAREWAAGTPVDDRGTAAHRLISAHVRGDYDAADAIVRGFFATETQADALGAIAGITLNLLNLFAKARDEDPATTWRLFLEAGAHA
jgi:hypothetical protein